MLRSWPVRALDACGVELDRRELDLCAEFELSTAVARFRAFVLRSGGDLRESVRAAIEERQRRMDEIHVRMSEKLAEGEAKELGRELYAARNLVKELQLLVQSGL